MLFDISFAQKFNSSAKSDKEYDCFLSFLRASPLLVKSNIMELARATLSRNTITNKNMIN